jgi:hypothetical protein
MKKTILRLSIYSLMLFAVTSCGSSSNDMDSAEMDMPEMTDETLEDAAEDFSSLTTAEDAMDEYKDLLEEYSDLVADGDAEAAAELKSKLDDLKAFAEGEFGSDELKALTDLSKLAIQLEAGKMVDLDKAFDAYDKSLEMLKEIPMDAETEEALNEAKDAMKDLEGLGGF